jgi:hypothetical protein
MIQLTQTFCDRCHSTKEVDAYFFPKKLFSLPHAAFVTFEGCAVSFDDRAMHSIDLCNSCLTELGDLFKDFLWKSDNE